METLPGVAIEQILLFSLFAAAALLRQLAGFDRGRRATRLLRHALKVAQVRETRELRRVNRVWCGCLRVAALLHRLLLTFCYNLHRFHIKSNFILKRIKS